MEFEALPEALEFFDLEEKPLKEPTACSRIFLENIPIECSEDDVRKSVLRCTGISPTNVEIQEISLFKKVARFALVSFEDEESLKKVLSPTRETFGVHVNGLRCPIYDSEFRMNHILVQNISKRYAMSSVEERVKKLVGLMPGITSKISFKHLNLENGKHLGFCIVTFKNHSEAEAALRGFRQSEWVKNAGLELHYFSSSFPHWSWLLNEEKKFAVVDSMLHKLKKRASHAEEQCRNYRALLEQLGYTIDFSGNAFRTKAFHLDLLFDNLDSRYISEIPTDKELRRRYAEYVLKRTHSVEVVSKVLDLDVAEVRRVLEKEKAEVEDKKIVEANKQEPKLEEEILDLRSQELLERYQRNEVQFKD